MLLWLKYEIVLLHEKETNLVAKKNVHSCAWSLGVHLWISQYTLSSEPLCFKLRIQVELTLTSHVFPLGPKWKGSQLSGKDSSHDTSLESKKASPTLQANFKSMSSSHALWHHIDANESPNQSQCRGDGKYTFPQGGQASTWMFALCQGNKELWQRIQSIAEIL